MLQKLSRGLHTAGVGVLWVTFVYGEMQPGCWASQQIWIQGFMFGKVWISTILDYKPMYGAVGLPPCNVLQASDVHKSLSLCICMIKSKGGAACSACMQCTCHAV